MVPEFLLKKSAERTSADALINLSGNLTAFLALIGAIVSIWFTYSQIRAKVRADNRQEWLGITRTLMARVIALSDDHARAVNRKKKARLYRKLSPLRLELELRLNPNEKDHRLLMYLLRRLTFFDEPERLQAADDILPLEIKTACDAMTQRDPIRYGTDRYKKDWEPILEAGTSAALVTSCMRLSHVVLKREWERVKSTR